MAAIVDMIQGAPGAAPILVPNNGDAHIPVGQVGAPIIWVPGVILPALEVAANRILALARKVYALALIALSTAKDLIGDMNATNDLLSLFISVTELCEKKFPVPLAHQFADVFKSFMSINSPRSLFHRFYSIFSGEAATQEPFENHYDWLRVFSKAAFLAPDLCKFAQWLHSIGVLEAEALQQIEQKWLPHFAPSLNSVIRIGTIAGSIFNSADNIRLIKKYWQADDDTPERERSYKHINAWLDTVNDVCRIACSILQVAPFPFAPIAKIGTEAFSNSVSLVKFFIGAYSKEGREAEKAQCNAIKAAALQVIERELENAAQARGDASTSQRAIHQTRVTLDTLSQKRRLVLLSGVVPFARRVITEAIARPPQPDQPPLDPSAVAQLQSALAHLNLPMPPRG